MSAYFNMNIDVKYYQYFRYIYEHIFKNIKHTYKWGEILFISSKSKNVRIPRVIRLWLHGIIRKDKQKNPQSLMWKKKKYALKLRSDLFYLGNSKISPRFSAPDVYALNHSQDSGFQSHD